MNSLKKEQFIQSVLLLALVLGLPVTSAQAQWISSVARTGNSAQPVPVIASAPLAEGSVCYNDRLYVYASVPTEILGAQYVQVSNTDKNTTDYTLTVTMGANATLYLFLDNCLGDTAGGQGVDPILPAQMSWVTDLGFTDAGLDIGIDEIPGEPIENYFSVFSKQVNAGDVIALGVQDAGPWNMYAVAAMPRGQEPVVCPISSSDILATASSFITWPYRTIDGSGLNANDEHGTSTGLMWTSSGDAPLPAWIKYEFDKVYELHQMWVWNHNSIHESDAGLGVKDAAIEYSLDGSNWTPLGDFQFAQGPGADGYVHNTEVQFDGALAKYVRITCNDNWGGSSQCGLSEVRFYCICTYASAPNPPDEATDVPTDVALTWIPGTGATLHHIYFGTNQADVATGTGDTDKGTQGQTYTSYTPGALANDTTYYWRVDEFDGAMTWMGEIWSFTTTSPHGLIAWWKLDETTDTTAADSSGNGNNGACQGDVAWVEGKIGGAWQGDGAGDFIKVPHSDSLMINDAITVAMWVYGGIPPHQLICKSNGSGTGWQSNYAIRLDNRVDLYRHINWRGRAIPNQSLTSTGTIPENEWTHVACTFDITEGINRIYLNGVLDKENESTLKLDPGYGPLYIGADQYPADTARRWWQGKLDDIRIYNYALTASKIADIVSGGSNIATNPTPTDGATDVPTDAILSWTPGVYAGTHDVYFGTVLEHVEQARRWNDPHGVLVSQNQMANNYDPPVLLEYAQTYYWRIDEVSAPPTPTIFMGNIWSFTTTLPPSLIGWWKLDDGSGTVVLDSSGYGNHATINNLDGGLGADGSVWYSDSQYGTVASFNGDDTVGAYISAGSIPAMTLTNGFTWAFWAKQDIEQGTGPDSGGHDVVLGNRYDGTQSPVQFIKFTPRTFEFWRGGQYGIDYDDIPGGVWIHHAVVKNGQSLTYYRDGVVSGTRTIGVTIDANPFHIGGDPLGERWRGLISDVRIYNYALTPLEVAAIVAESNMDSDGVRDAVEDGAPNNGDGNNDDTPDSQQNNVTSLPKAVGEGYVTIVSPTGTSLEDVSAIVNPSPGDAPEGVEFPAGFFNFTVCDLTNGSAMVTLILPLGQTVGTYYKYGPEPGPGNETPHWYEFLWDGQTGAKINGNVITLYFVDGLRGDGDLEVNGQIVDPGAPAMDTKAPTILGVWANPTVLWPVNHKMVKVAVAVSCKDNVDPAPVCKIVEVTCNEPFNAPGDGNTSPDYEITGNLTVNLRAERSGTAGGRVYTIHVNCVDASGNRATTTVNVTVPHDLGKGK